MVERWIETPYWQHFGGKRSFLHELPCDADITAQPKAIAHPTESRLLNRARLGLRLGRSQATSRVGH